MYLLSNPPDMYTLQSRDQNSLLTLPRTCSFVNTLHQIFSLDKLGEEKKLVLFTLVKNVPQSILKPFGVYFALEKISSG